jgi:cytochrome c553
MKPSLLALIAVAALARAASAEDAKKVDFAKDVAPIFKANCVKCHGTDPKKPKKKPAAKLNLEDEAGALKGGKVGKDVIPGDAKDSLLFKLLSGPVTVPTDDGTADKDIDPMPKVKKGEKFKPLKDEEIATIKAWIDQLPPSPAPAK